LEAVEGEMKRLREARIVSQEKEKYISAGKLLCQHDSATRQGGVPMNMLKSGRLAAVFFVVSYFGVSLLGCATTSQIQALEERTQQALEKAEQAVKEARSAKAAVEDSAEYSYEAAASARRADNAASRAEDAASRAEKAAESAVWSAERAEKMAKKCEDIFRRIMSK